MTSVRRLGVWLQGARPRTLVAAVAPVFVGTGVAHAEGGVVSWVRALLALVVALALQVGVNFANDYSDGMRGTDVDRVGPPRLTATGVVAPAAVRNAAAIALGVAAIAGLALSIIVTPWLLLVGAGSIAAAVLYTGGPKPYGYSGFGEVAVLACFGFAATAGSAYVQLERVPATAWWCSVTLGLLACVLLVANNIRDIATDAVAGKRTLAVRLGEQRARILYMACVAGAFLAVIPVGIEHTAAFAAFAAAPLAVKAVRVVQLQPTAMLLWAVAALLGGALWLS